MLCRALGRRNAHRFCLAIAAACALEAQGAPVALSPKQAAPIQVNAYFGWDGLAFYSNKLYAACPAGLAEFTGGSFSTLYTWGKDSSAITGLWYDRANGLLWVSIANEVFWQYDGSRWRAIRRPKPSQGFTTRQDIWRGFRGISDSRALWLVGAGRAWAWQGPPPGKWREEKLPAAFGTNRVTGPLLKSLIPTDDRTYFVRRDHNEPGAALEMVAELTGEYYRIEGDSVFALVRSRWDTVTNRAGRFFTLETSDANGKGYVRTKSGEVLEITGDGVSAVQSPGVCEAICRSGAGTLLGAFRGLGVFELKEHWRKVLDSPHSDADQPHAILLAASEREIAFAVRPVAHGRQGVSHEHRAQHRDLWISEGPRWIQLSLPTREQKP